MCLNNDKEGIKMYFMNFFVFNDLIVKNKVIRIIFIFIRLIFLDNIWFL